MKFKNPECARCGKTASPKQMIRLTWKKKGVDVDLCPPCFRALWNKHLKELKMGVDTMAKSGYYDLGAREVDFKSYLWKWAKREVEKL